MVSPRWTPQSAANCARIQPAGLNASSEGEIRVFYDWIGAYQEQFFTSNLTRVLGFIQLSLWGKVDEDITFTFEPLWSLDEKALAEIRKLEGEVGRLPGRAEAGAPPVPS